MPIPMRILSATYRIDNKIKETVYPSGLTKESYKKKYKGNLFCPNEACKAQIVFVKMNEGKYFRTLPVKLVDGEVEEQHIHGCIHSVEHILEERALRRIDSKLISQISLSHIKSSLDYAYDRQFDPERFKKKAEKAKENKKKGPSSQGKIDKTLRPKGRLGLNTDGAQITEMEPRVTRKSVNDIVEQDYATVQCIHGFVKDMVIDGEYPYINFVTNDGRKARILFSEAFSVNSPDAYQNVRVYKNYIDLRNQTANPTFVACIGKITKDNFEISVVIESLFALHIDKKNFYRILREINHFD